MEFRVIRAGSAQHYPSNSREYEQVFTGTPVCHSERSAQHEVKKLLLHSIHARVERFFACFVLQLTISGIIGLLLFSTLPIGAHAAPTALTFSEYRAALANVLTHIQSARSGSKVGLGQARAAAAALRRVTVTLPDGTGTEADNTWLTVELSATNPNYERIEQQLLALLADMDRVLSAAKVQNPDEARELLRRVLERPQFQRTRERSIADVILEYILEALFGLLRRSAPGSGPNLFVILAGTCMAILLGAVVLYFTRNMLRNLNTSARAQGFSADEAGMTAQQAWKRAEDLARTGDRRTAVRYLYLSALLYLDEKNMLVFDRSMTNREYLHAVAANERLSALLGPIVGVFDRVWYGGLLPNDAEYAEYTDLVRQIKELAPA